MSGQILPSKETLSRKSTELGESEHSADIVIEEKSIGVRKAEILAHQWNGWFYKVILLCSAFLVGYGYGLDGQLRFVLVGYATLSFHHHSFLTLISVVQAIAAAGVQPVYARLSDLFGRLELFIVSIGFYVVGTIIESQAHDIERYAAGAVLYQVGYSGVIIVLLFILSDFSSLNWRLFYSFVPAFPFIINTWIAGNVKSAIGMDWSWGVGMWAFIFPLACVPMLCCMLHMRYLAGKTEEWRVFKQRRTKFQELGVWGFVKYLYWNLDVVGLFIFVVLLGLILAPLTVSVLSPKPGVLQEKWKQAGIIVPMVFGVILLPVFMWWEYKGARNPFFPWTLMKDRGIWSAMAISFLFDFISGIETSYLYAVLLVAVNETDKSATRITSLTSFVSVVGAIFYGLFMTRFRRLKGFIIFGISMWIVAFGILVHYRGHLGAHSGIIGGLCLLGFGTTFFTYPLTVSAQSCVKHENMAKVTSMLYTVYRVGSAVGSAVAAAIWNDLMYKRVAKRTNGVIANSLYNSPYLFVSQYEWGTPTREAVIGPYQSVQKVLMIVCLCFCFPMLFIALFLRDHQLGNQQSYEDVEEIEQNDSFTDFVKKLFRGKIRDENDVKDVKAAAV